MKAESAGQGMACGEAPMRHLAGNGARTASGAPGFHPLGHCRGMPAEPNAGTVSHVEARKRQGAGVTVEGRVRAAGKIGAAMVISGRGAAIGPTTLGQCHSHGLPTLLISAKPEARAIGRDWCFLHEIAEQERVTEPLCVRSAMARGAADSPGLLARARFILSSQCPRPHISPRHGVHVGIVEENREPVALPRRHALSSNKTAEAARMHRASPHPMVLFGDVNVGAAFGLTVAARAHRAPVWPGATARGFPCQGSRL